MKEDINLKWHKHGRITGGNEFQADYNDHFKALVHTNAYGIVVMAGVWIDGEQRYANPFAPLYPGNGRKQPLDVEEAKKWCATCIQEAVSKTPEGESPT